MIKVVLLGAGNLASHLFRVFRASKDVEIIQVFNHRQEKLADFTNKVATTTLFSEIKDADFYLISVKDDTIAEVSSQLKSKNSIVLHTSGAVSFKGMHYDEGAKLAKAGKVNVILLKSLSDNAFFKLQLPKTTGPEVFNLALLRAAQAQTATQDLSHEDVLATLNTLSATTIARQPLRNSRSREDAPRGAVCWL